MHKRLLAPWLLLASLLSLTCCARLMLLLPLPLQSDDSSDEESSEEEEKPATNGAAKVSSPSWPLLLRECSARARTLLTLWHAKGHCIC
jgi:hypothetical protein